MSAITWRYLAFDELTNAELYAALQLRSEIFVLEQACLFQDMDGADTEAMHLLGMLQNQLVAYARCVPAGVQYPQASLGRILIHKLVRGTGLGHALVDEAIACLVRQSGPQAIKISAQAHLENFYRQHDFVKIGSLYLEDGIPHIEMLRSTRACDELWKSSF